MVAQFLAALIYIWKPWFFDEFKVQNNNKWYNNTLINVFVVSFDQYNASLLIKSKKKKKLTKTFKQ